MSTGSDSSAPRIPQENLAEAGVWLARLKGPSRNRELEEGFREWLGASPMNARAFEITTDVWQEAANLNRIVPVTSIQHRPVRASRMTLAVGFLAVALVALGIWLLPPRGIATAVGEQRTLNLEDGTHVLLNTSTRVVVHYDREARRIELKGGEALFNVAQRSNWPFVVTVNHHQVRALGTSFVVRRDLDHLDVTLIDGKVSIAADGDGAADEVVLKPGERLSIATTGAVKIERPQLDTALAWRRGQVILNDTPLSAAIAEMNRYSSVKVSVERPEANGLLVNGLFQAGDSKSFAEAVANIYGLRVQSQDGRLVLTGVPHH